MYHIASWRLRLVYILVVAVTILPFGISNTGWVAATIGGRSSALAALPLVGPLVLLALGVYRIWLVLRSSETLNSYRTAGAASVLRVLGLVALHVGAIVGVINFAARPMMRMLVSQPSDSGIEFYVVGVLVGLISGVGPFGIILFEFSRLLAFESEARGADA